jgi:hypothetical protein
MNTIIDLFRNLWNLLACIGEVQGLDGDTPIPQPKADTQITGPTKLISTPILGGLHHRYQRVAA